MLPLSNPLFFNCRIASELQASYRERGVHFPVVIHLPSPVMYGADYSPLKSKIERGNAAMRLDINILGIGTDRTTENKPYLC